MVKSFGKICHTYSEVAPVARADGRTALLSAAVHVAATQGLRKLTYRAIAKEAGVAHTLVAHHFGTREALLRETLAFAVERTLPTISDAPGSGDLDEFLSRLGSITAADPDDQALFFALSLESRHTPSLRPLVEDLYATFRSAIAAELTAAGLGDDEDLVHLVVAAADGLLFQQLCFGDAERTERGVEQLRRMLAGLHASADLRIR
jgi:AcrR family transcriptional regulator